MDIPNYQSQNAGPKTSGLDAANPGIVGGGPIVQGLANASQGMLVYAHYQQQQQRADQISEAGNILNTVGQQLSLKANDLRKRQAEQPGNPRLVAEEYTTFAEQLINDTLADPTLQASPFMHKYIATHLPTLSRAATAHFQTEQDGNWKQWDQAQSSIVMEDFKRIATTNPALRDEATKQAQAHLMGRTAIGSISGEQFASQWSAWKGELSYSKDMLYAKSNAQSWVDATMRGTYPAGFDPTGRTKEQLQAIDSTARETFSLMTSTSKDQEAQHRQRMSEGYEQQKNIWLSRSRNGWEDESGKTHKADTVGKILGELGTKQSKGVLGDKWDTVHTFYQSLEQHLQSAGGAKPSPQKLNAVLQDIYGGTKYKDEVDLLKGIGDFDNSTTMELLGKFGSYRTKVDQHTQERVRQSIDVIKGRFALPGGAALDPADSQGRMNTVMTRHFLWLEGLRAQGKDALGQADVIGQAQKMADQEYRNMADSVINIVPRTEASLIYKTPNEVAAALKAEEITERQANSYLLEIDQFHQLQTIAGGKTPSLGQGRSEAFK